VLPPAFLRIFSEVTYIRTVGNSNLLKIYTLPNHTITIGVCILKTQLLGLLYGGGAIVSCRNGPCRGCLQSAMGGPAACTHILVHPKITQALTTFL
jgi:hypothetical protein